jgi:2',3'-cyclic-nucleotide 2'-phosphodiesterase/3'-nucleotidase
MKTKFTLQIIQTSDVHGYVYPTNYINNKELDLGLAKVQTKIKQIKKKNCLLIDSGDSIQGSPLDYYYFKKKQGHIHPMATVYNVMNYDYITIGNHEFNYGPGVLNSFLSNLNATVINSNILNKGTNKPFFGVSHDIKEYNNGLKIGIIGVTTHYIPNWEQPANIKDLLIKDAFETTKSLAKKLKKSVDYLIVSYHGGFERNLESFALEVEDTGENQGAKMLLEIPEIDLLLTGHQHRTIQGKYKNTSYVQPSFNGQLFSEIIVDFTYKTSWTSETKITLHDVKNVTADPEVLDIIHECQKETQNYLNVPVGTLDNDLLITNQFQARFHKHPIVSLINTVQLQETNAEISLCSLGNEVSGFRKEITLRDILGTYPFPNTLVVKAMKGSEIKKALEKTAEFFAIKNGTIVISDKFLSPKKQLYSYDMYDPISYTIVVSNPIGNRIKDLTYNEKPLDLNHTYKVVMNNYRAAGGGDYVFIKNCPTIQDTQKEVIEVLSEYILQSNHISIHHIENIKVVL